MKRVLFISYFFPPVGGTVVQRALKFVKYLPEFQWEPVVLTAEGGWTIEDETLLSEPFLRDRKIIRVAAPEVKKYYSLRKKNNLTTGEKCAVTYLQAKHFFYPDPMIGWVNMVKKNICRIIDKEKIDLVFTTSPPLSEHLLGKLAKEKCKLPWVADFRDSVETCLVPTRWQSRVKGRFGRKYERLGLANADKIVTINNPIVDYFCRNYGEEYRNKVFVISNGYDESEFAELAPRADYLSKDKLIITYTGIFPGVRSPKLFIDGLRIFLNKDKTRAGKIEIRFVGDFSEAVKSEFNSPENLGCIKTIGHVAHRESIAYQLSSDVLLLVISAKSELGGDQVLTNKIYEYLRARKFIFGLVPPNGAAANVIKELNAGLIVDRNQPESVADALEKIFLLRQKKELQALNDNLKIPKQYDRKVLAGKLADVFNSLING